ncbi:EI24 domain-containing protein, partial [Segetibacter sp.]|uniref:EI24 domain-containing protein n=1 Tax=Segetibacter sp. TaxID=2231182 RepID=UPI0026234C08
MLKDIVTAIQSYRLAHAFIRKHKLWKWIIIPGLIYMVMFCVSMYFFGKSASSVIEWLSIETGLKHWIESMESTIAGLLFTIAGIILWLILMLFYFSLFKYIWLILGSPIFAYLSEKIEDILEGKSTPFHLSQFLKDVARGIRIALRNTLWQSVYLIAFLILSFIPVVGWITPFFVLLIECYYYGFSMLDYTLERNHLTASESIHFIGKRKGLAIANGLMFYLLHLIPIIGWL